MYQLSINKRSLGVTFPAHQQAQVAVWAPNAKQIAVKINDQSAGLPLKREALGYWCLETSQLKPGDLYTFLLDGETERSDPASLCQPNEVHGPSLAIDTASFYWEDESWVNPPVENYLIYELHVGTFTPGGTFAALETKLDYLKALGITAIELMPIAQFSDSRNWGYDGIFTFAAQYSYGGATGLQHLINACHYRGIAVILDVVYNHFGPEGNHLNEFGPYLTSKYCTPWGDAINFDDAWCDGVRHYFIENVLMWFRDFHIDALRMDAVHAIKDFSPVHILQEIRQKVDQLMEVTGRRHHLFIENDLNDPRYINPVSENGYGMDAQWMDEFHHALRVTVGEKKVGYYADFNGIDHLEKSYRDAYVYDGQFSSVRKKLFGVKADKNPGQQFIVFSQNHDQIGNRKQGERSSQLYSYDTIKLMAGAVLLSPYVPLLFMGEEWGESNPFFYFATHYKPALIAAVKQGREDEFGSSKEAVPDPQTEETYDKTKLQWDMVEQEPHQSLLRYYQTLIALRQQLPALYTLNRQQLEVTTCNDQQTLLLHRWHEDQHVLCIMNFNKQQQAVSLSITDDNRPWQKLLDSADPQWLPQTDCPSAPDSVDDTHSFITLPPESLVVYAQGHEKSQLSLPNPISPRLYHS